MSLALEITILSAENIHVHKKPIKKNTFVSLQSDSTNGICYSTKENSREGGGGTSCPLWNEKVVMEVPLDARFITAEVKCKASRGVVKSVGVAKIPVSDLYVQDNQVHFLSYRLWDTTNVRRNGVINISVRVKVPECLSPVIGIPVAREGGNSNRVVTGIPVWLSNL